VTTKETIQFIREAVRDAQEKGESSIPAENLQQFLNHLDSGQVDKDIGLLFTARKETTLAKYRARADAQLELFKSVIQSGQAALKSLFLLNGGAAVAVLALIGHLSTSTIAAAQVNKFAVPLLSFACGLAFAAMASGFTYLVQRAYSTRNRRHGERLNHVVVLLSIGSLVAFAVGCGFAYAAIQELAANQPR
jgi:hypothetical protein